MRYLYADSEPFPPMYDFIAALDAFVVHGARVAQSDAEIRALREKAARAQAARRKSAEELEAFHAATVQTLETKLPAAADASTLEYARRLSELAAQLVAESKKSLEAAEQQEGQVERREAERCRVEIRTALEAFLSVLRLPVVDVKVSMRLNDGRNDLSAVFSHPDRIVTSFTLHASKLAEWRQPRKVAEFATDVELPVGVKRGWFSKSVHQEVATIDESIIGSFDLEAHRSEIRLRRKLTDKDAFAIVLQRNDAQVNAELHYLDDPQAEGQRTTLDAEAVANLQRFWDGLLKGLTGALTQKEKLVSVQFQGADVVDEDRAGDFLREVVALLAPVVNEIARRTPNSAELSLKVEKEGSRREEIYVRKADLAGKLESLAPELRALFAPLGFIAAPPKAEPETEVTIETGELAADDVLPPAKS